jgi:glycosyltransferase involved in cell wall biosynthesis
MNTPLVSVIMPVFNVERFIGAAIESVLDQRLTDFELIIIDDGGSDASVSICQSYHDPRVIIISQRNRGLAGARNTGIAAARGRYIALLDADDRWHPDKLLLHSIHLEANPAVDVSYSGSQLIDADGAALKTAMQPRLTAITAAHILMRNPVGNGSAAVIRRTALDTLAFVHPDHPRRLCWFDESFRQSEDIELWLRMAAVYDCKFEGIEGLLTEYRIIHGGLSANVARQFESWQRAIDKTRRAAPALIAQYGDKAAAYQLRYLARRAVQLGDGPFALSLVAQALARYPMMLLAEPYKSLTTAAAALALRHLPSGLFRALAGRHVGLSA